MAKRGQTGGKQFKEVFDRIEQAFTELEVDVLEEAGQYVQKRMVQKARTGKQMLKNGNEKRFEKLSKEYVDERKRRKAAGDPELDKEFFSPQRANLTLTGQFLKSIGVLKIDKKQGLIVIGADGSRTDGMTNATLAKHLAKLGRSIFALDETGRKFVTNLLKRRVRERLRKNLLRK